MENPFRKNKNSLERIRHSTAQFWVEHQFNNEISADSNAVHIGDGYFVTTKHTLKGFNFPRASIRTENDYHRIVRANASQVYDLAVLYSPTAATMDRVDINSMYDLEEGETVYFSIEREGRGLVKGRFRRDFTLNMREIYSTYRSPEELLRAQNWLIMSDVIVKNGDSGSGVFNSRGELIGIAQATLDKDWTNVPAKSVLVVSIQPTLSLIESLKARIM